MTIKVLANKVLAFDRGEKDAKGNLKTVRTNIGFCELPDWAAETDYFKLATIDGSVKSFTSPGESEAVLKEQEKLAALKAEVAALEEKRDMMSVLNGSEASDPDSDADANSDADLNPDHDAKAKTSKLSKTTK
ncbi:hypothetical protein E4K67_22455 [Desulfosporosinus fructosivorans]|uniref:Uncharacterized protein n=1 Tax=Desulfosporosinus fructosivorans TaxID=2018669 RepID=A0A4Z0QYK5_9FIRM|nr:hypothetical protein [Desulfosporosinus fructosivorans]TGE35881.1 hypothetical protein E4K67_22455 [Desulfosporosinus fructosivorans]